MTIIDKILKIEEENRGYSNYKVYNNEILLWSMIRVEIFVDIVNKNLNLEKAHAFDKKINVFNLIKYLLNVLKFSPYKVKEKDILIFGHGITNVKNGEVFYNKVNEYFVDEFRNETNYIEMSTRQQFFLPKNEENLFFRDLVKIRIKIFSKIFSKVPNEDEDTINNFIEKLKNDFSDYELDFNHYKNVLLKITKELKHYFREYERVFKKGKPKVLFLEDGNYGGENAIISYIAKKNNIKVGEFQHGYVCSTHKAYNYGKEELIGEYKQFVPDYYLTYGKFWSENIRTLGKVIEIGNPHFEKMLEKYKHQAESVKIKTIVIISQGTVTKKMVDFALELNKAIDKTKYRIIFRLHSGEVPFVERYEVLNQNNIELSKSGDIYELIAKSDIIVGSSSTVLFEAKAFNKKIFILNNSDSEFFVSKDFGVWVNNYTEFLEKLNQVYLVQNDREKDYFWKDNWKENYREFLKKEIGIE